MLVCRGGAKTFLGFEICDLSLFEGCKSSDGLILSRKILAVLFLGFRKASLPQGSRFYVTQLHHFQLIYEFQLMDYFFVQFWPNGPLWVGIFGLIPYSLSGI